MASYLTLIKFTDSGMQNMAQGGDRIDAMKDAAREAGGRVIFFYSLMGDYDLAVLYEMPNDEALMKILLATNARGHVRTTTMKAFTEDETRQLMASALS